MLGPLAISAWGQRGVLDLLLVGVAAVGVAILSLAHGATGEIEPIGIAFALAAARPSAAYIVAGKTVGKLLAGLNGSPSRSSSRPRSRRRSGWRSPSPACGPRTSSRRSAAAGVLATLVPFALEMTALRSLSMATFGLLLAFEPGIASDRRLRRARPEPHAAPGRGHRARSSRRRRRRWVRAAGCAESAGTIAS